MPAMSSSDSKTREGPGAGTSKSRQLKIDKSGLYDLMQVKRLLDDEVISFLEEQGYEEATTASNIKIVCGTIATIAAVYSHFNKMTFPDNRMLIIICVAIYGVCSLITSGVIFFMEGSAFYAGTVPPKARKTTKKDFTPSVWARSQLGQKGSSTYVLHLHARARGAFTSEMKHGYEKYFTTEGRFLQAPFRADLGATLGSFNRKKDK